ncbi:MAG: helix-hairpin-helix domain-containing protein [Phycisphaerae bacterium]|nr:helix-hairpin-helix domain-containing protein [Phycisphaerae bacterium]
MRTPGQTPQFAFLLLSLGAVVLGLSLMFHEGMSCQTPPNPLVAKINPNTASLGELLILPGIGTTRAEAIVAYRDMHFPKPAFTCIEDLYHVHGLGPALVRDMAPWLCLEDTPVK